MIPDQVYLVLIVLKTAMKQVSTVVDHALHALLVMMGYKMEMKQVSIAEGHFASHVPVRSR
jgi:hypothetical protein